MIASQAAAPCSVDPAWLRSMEPAHDDRVTTDAIDRRRGFTSAVTKCPIDWQNPKNIDLQILLQNCHQSIRVTIKCQSQWLLQPLLDLTINHSHLCFQDRRDTWYVLTLLPSGQPSAAKRNRFALMWDRPDRFREFDAVPAGKKN